MLDFRITFGKAIDTAVEWVADHGSWLFGAMKSVFLGLYNAVDWLFSTPDEVVVIAVLAVAALFARGWKFAVGTVLGLLFIVSVNQWDTSMDSLSLVIVAAFLAIVVSVPLGIWAARSPLVAAIVKPILDFLQTMPALVYLLPAIALFRIGVAPGIFATVLFALAPGVRLTELGIRGVDKEVVEAGQAFGASPGRILRQIQLPLALPSIMAGINQIIMLSLSMVVIAGFVGAGGLGGEVTRALSSLNKPLGYEAGLSVVILAILLDRFTGAFGQKRGLRLIRRLRDTKQVDSPIAQTAGKDTERILAEHSGNRRQPGR